MKDFTLFFVLCIYNLSKCEESTNVIEISTTETTTFENVNTTLDCDEKNEFCTTVASSESPAKTTPMPNKTNTNISNETTVKNLFRSSPRETCPCDLQSKICDINCCCDEDCSFDNKNIFSECIEEHDIIYDTRYCKYTGYIYKNNTPFQWDVNQNGLFCIVKTNLHVKNVHQNKKIIKTLEDGHLQKQNKYLWPSLKNNQEQTLINISKEIKYGDIIWAIKNKSVHPFQLPNHFLTTACLARNNILHLENFKSTCSQSYLAEDNFDLRADTYVENVTFVAAPKLYNTTLLNEKFKGCPKNICISLETKICTENYKSCSDIAEKNKPVTPSCNISFKDNKKTCNNFVNKAKYIFFHNGTNGITNVSLYLILTNFSHSLSDEKVEFFQEFETIFYWTNNSVNFTKKRSGNPGYLIGKPVLVAKLLINETIINVTGTNTTKTEVNTTIIRNHLDFTENFLTLPENKGGICILNNSTNYPVEFGFNIILKCKIKSTYEINKNLTANETCRELQKVIFIYWSISIGNKTARLIGAFGNANFTIVKDWFSVLYEETPDKKLNKTFGIYSKKNSTVTCYNIATTFKIDIFHSRVTFKNLGNQEKIVGTIFDFVGTDNFTFAVNKGKISLEVPLRHEVMFLDVTKRIERYREHSMFSFTLPRDFFYPVKLSSEASAVSFNASLIVLCAQLFICCIKYFVL